MAPSSDRHPGDGRWAPAVLALLVFGPATAIVYALAFRPPGAIVVELHRHPSLAVLAMVVYATATAYCCRRVVQALLRVVGF